jgi:hypothetical protein
MRETREHHPKLKFVVAAGLSADEEKRANYADFTL